MTGDNGRSRGRDIRGGEHARKVGVWLGSDVVTFNRDLVVGEILLNVGGFGSNLIIS